MRPSLPRFLSLALALGVFAPSDADAQRVSGRLLDEASEAPVPGAAIFLVDRDGDGRARAESDSLGRFFLDAPAPGDYTLVASRLGYERARTPLLRIEGSALPRIDLLMRPLPLGLEGLEVTVDANAAVRRELRLYGVDPRLIPDARFVTRDEILARQGAIDLASVLQWQNVPGLEVRRGQNVANSNRWLAPCVTFARERSGAGQPVCALYVIDGVPDRHGALFANLGETDVDAMVVLSPRDGATLFGGEAGGGVVLVFTRGSLR